MAYLHKRKIGIFVDACPQKRVLAILKDKKHIVLLIHNSMIRKKYILVFGFCLLCLTSYSQVNKQINEVFKRFQYGYTKRDTSFVDAFVNDLCAKDIQILGTGEDELLQGMNAAKNFFKNDWLYWFDLKLDTSTLKVTTIGDVTLFLMNGTASMTFPDKEKAYDFAYKRLQQLVNTEKTSGAKLLSYSSEAANLIQQIESGGLEIKYSIRLSGAIVRQDNRWLFKQLVFSFPYPMSRK
ncbi:nuclear transport factor 2 family protein [Thermoflavifilum thermophilum]|uniref:SnoaL-like domain-containing protein n=1 Tax=Thermoflavifilum thermophilum TaxID=1393122 RepID=A0A1I7NI15_9BACT|nr:nuclear transport factor 2 family protein [Thermoflavifilum thermophilum]SFV34301.1 SnoaL-like domain-containing protein [Thermoflavifilum thermophilum]